MDNFDITQLFSVEGLVAVVTGGGTGIGLCIFLISWSAIDVFVDISSALAQNGATVYIVGRRKEKLEMAVKMHQSVDILRGRWANWQHLKGKLIPLVADVTSKEDLKRIAFQVEQEQGYINILSISILK